ncbi:MAG TPA: hypothetical protein VGU24_08390 [Microvirga sp.]|jgi:hypothetical protein|nr:hypothetical protein [Microvirga sp.]
MSETQKVQKTWSRRLKRPVSDVAASKANSSSLYGAVSEQEVPKNTDKRRIKKLERRAIEEVRSSELQTSAAQAARRK